MTAQVLSPVTSKSILRTAKDELADTQERSENLRKGLYTEWPNEAGFDGLTEERGPIELTVQGSIPPWAAGSLYRTGPGNCKVEDTPKGTYYVSHWFDGFAHTHRFEIVDPQQEQSQPTDDASASPPASDAKVRVIYNSRRQAEHVVAAIKASGYRGAYSFGQKRDPCIGIFGKAMSFFQKPPRVGSNVCVAVNADVPGLHSSAVGLDDPAASGHRTGVKNIWLSTDASPMLEVDAETLEPIGEARQINLHPDLTGPVSCAHAQRDPSTGDMYNFNLELSKTPTYRVFRVNAATGKTEILAAVADTLTKAAYIHSFFLTDNYVVMCVPVSHFGLNGLRVPWERNILDAIVPFDQTRQCRWIVIDRKGGAGVVATIDSPARFFFHTVNAFEEAVDGGKALDIMCDMVDYDNLDVMYAFYYDVLLNRNGATERFWSKGDRASAGHANLTRYRLRIPLTSSPVKSKAAGARKGTLETVFSIPAPHVGELPTINQQYLSKPYRYVYSCANRGLSTLLDCIVKTDTATRDALIWEPPHAHSPGEPIFVPRPPTDGEILDEDDGVLLSVVLDGTTQRSYMVCIDAKTMTETGRAECEFPVGFGFHGLHTPFRR